MITKLKLLMTLHKKSFISFLIVGALTAVVNFGSFTVLWKWAGINYLLSASLAYVLSVICHFSLNRRFTFKSHGENLFSHLKKYAIVVLITFLISIITTYLVTSVLLFSPYIGIAGGIAINVGLGYVMSRFWVFESGLKKI